MNNISLERVYDLLSVTNISKDCLYNIILTSLDFADVYSNRPTTIKDISECLIEVKGKNYNLPFIVTQEEKGFILKPFNDETYEIEKFYQDNVLFKSNKIPSIYYPILTKDLNTYPDFRSYLKSCKINLIGHFFGEKSKRITYLPLIKCNSTLGHKYIVDLSLNYVDRFTLINQKVPQVGSSLNFLTYTPDCYYIQVGLDCITNKIVSCMYVAINNYSATCSFITTSTNVEYKPYSLVLSNLLAVVKNLFYSDDSLTKFKDIEVIDFGIVDSSIGDYKNLINITQYPVMEYKKFKSKEQLSKVLCF